MGGMDGERHVGVEDLDEYNFVVSQTLRTEPEFHAFYNSYARSKGFSIRKSNVKRVEPDSLELTWRRFTCSNQGFRRDECFERTTRKRALKALTRCVCGAKLEVKWCSERKVWFVVNFKDIHSHPFAKPQHVFVLRSHRGLSNPQKAEAIEFGLGGLRTCQVMDVMDKNYGGMEETGFLMRDLYNLFAREKKERITENDANCFLNHMAKKESEDPEFFFKYSKDSEGRLHNVFWSDAQSQLDYDAFGDIVVFDSTYRVNKYNLPFVPFIGVNHHRSTVIFGCGIISDETIASFVWLLEAFLEAMVQKRPVSLITDGDGSMAVAIEMVLAEADHRLCSWHIDRNAVRYLSKEKLKEYHPMQIDEFERQWEEFRVKHDVSAADTWIWRMYELKIKWAAAYTAGRRFLGMQSNQRSESLNSKLHKHLDRKMLLMDLLEHYECALSSLRKKEMVLDAVASTSVPYTAKEADLLELHASKIFTPAIFPKVREQIQKLAIWEVAEETSDNGTVRYVVKSRVTVGPRILVVCTFNGNGLVNAMCECRLLECESILCAHIFCILRSAQVDIIPPCCVHIRWTIKAKSDFPSDTGSNMHVWSERMQRFCKLRNMGNLALFKASKCAEQSERIARFYDEFFREDLENDDDTSFMPFGPLPAHFSGANGASAMNVQNPQKIIPKGAPSKKKKSRT